MNKEKRNFIEASEDFTNQSPLHKRLKELVSKCVKSNNTNCTICKNKEKHKMRAQYSKCNLKNCTNKKKQCFRVLKCDTYSKYRIYTSKKHGNKSDKNKDSVSHEFKIEENSCCDQNQSISDDSVTSTACKIDSISNSDSFFDETSSFKCEINEKMTQTDELLDLLNLTNVPLVDLGIYLRDSYNCFFNEISLFESIKA
jgi:hypothetical protein